jgi:EAL domain-containing protein (putative c-di-GMP-specific phosphodiesterase class I)/CHASE2 domain-containing sensor protein
LALLLGLTLVAACLFGGFGQSLDEDLRAFRDSLHPRAASGNVVVVAIDARSLAEINHWPWSRSVHAQLISRLAAAHTRIAAFDVDFSSPSAPADDAAMALALASAGGTFVLPTFRQTEQSGKTSPYENLPIPAFRAHAFLASVNIQPELDGMVRQYETGVVTAHVVRPSMAAMVAESAGSLKRSVTIDSSIDPATIPRISSVDIIKGRVPDALLANKRVIIGATAVEIGDRYAVPRHGIVPGVIIQAMAAETLLQGSDLINYGGAPLLVAALAILLISCRVRGSKWRAGLLLLGMLAVVIVPLTLEELKLATLDCSPALGLLAAAFTTLVILAVQRALWRNKTTDAATGLPNAVAFAHHHRNRRERIVAVARLHHYGELSLLLGAQQTAELLLRIADRLRLATQSEVVYRVEANALLWMFDSNDFELLADRFAALGALFRAPLILAGHALDLSLTYGVSQGDDADIRTTCAQALLAANRAADQGLVWDIHSAAHGAEADWRLSLLGELDQALANGDLAVAFQPKSDIAARQISGAEALVRWNHPERGMIPPDHFIPTIEKEGRMTDLTLFVIDQVLATLQHWARCGFDQSIAVNISASLLGDRKFFAAAAGRIAAARIDRSKLVFEITESATFADPDRAITAMNAWRELGIALSIDDYGTGQSTLSYLKRLPATEIKIDKSFITDLAMSRNDQIMVRSTIALAHDLGFKVVAEGIENAETFDLLASFGCDTGQGWHIGRPMPLDAFNALLGVPHTPALAIAA